MTARTIIALVLLIASTLFALARINELFAAWQRVDLIGPRTQRRLQRRMVRANALWLVTVSTAMIFVGADWTTAMTPGLLGLGLLGLQHLQRKFDQALR